jgi:hypothetical protein
MHQQIHFSPLGAEGPLPRNYPAQPCNEVAIVQPVLVKQLENDMLTTIASSHVGCSLVPNNVLLWDLEATLTYELSYTNNTVIRVENGR